MAKRALVRVGSGGLRSHRHLGHGLFDSPDWCGGRVDHSAGRADPGRLVARPFWLAGRGPTQPGCSTSDRFWGGDGGGLVDGKVRKQHKRLFVNFTIQV